MGRIKGTGCVFLRGDIWYAKWVADGIVHVVSCKTRNKREALKKLEELTHPYQTKTQIETLENLQSKIRVLENEASQTPKDKAVKLMFAVETYKNDLGQSVISAGTEKAYDCKFTQLRKFLSPQGKEYMYEVTSQDAADFMAHVKQKCGAGTFNEYCITFRTIIPVLMRHDTNIRKNVFENFKLLKKDKSKGRRELTEDEVFRLISVAEKRNADEGLFFRLGAMTALRKSDLLNLQWSMIDWNGRMIRLIPIKTRTSGNKSSVPIIDAIYKPLKDAYDNRTDETFVFPRLKGVSEARISAIISAVFAKAGIVTSVKDKNGKTHIITGFHALRKTMAIRLHRSGMPLTQLKLILGHSNITMSMDYAEAQDSDLHIPDFDTSNVRLHNDVIELVQSKCREGETIDDCIRRVFSRPMKKGKVGDKLSWLGA